MTQFSSKLSKIRKSKNMSQADLAKALQVRQSTISHWENGKCVPLITEVIRIAKILEVSPVKLVEYILKDIKNSCDYTA